MARAYSTIAEAFENYGSLTVAPFTFEDKAFAINYIVRTKLEQLSTMFKVKVVEDIRTLDTRHAELYTLQRACILAEHKGDLYAFPASLAGEPDPYFMPTKAVVNNPALNLNKEYTIGKDCAVIYNDLLHIGVMPTLSKWATLLVEAELTLLNKIYIGRIEALVSAGDEQTRKSAELFFEKVKAGQFSIISNQSLLDSLRTSPYKQSGTNEFTEVIQLEQYLDTKLWQAFGLQAGGYNLKSQYINEAETELGMGTDILAPVVSDMMEERFTGWDMANRLFGIHSEVELGSSWRIRNDKDGNGINDELEEAPEEETAETEPTEEQEETEDKKKEEGDN